MRTVAKRTGSRDPPCAGNPCAGARPGAPRGGIDRQQTHHPAKRVQQCQDGERPCRTPRHRPHGRAARRAHAQRDEQTAYLLIAQHYLAALLPDYTFNETRLTLEAGGVAFTASARIPVDQGWKSVFGADPDSEDEEDTTAPVLPDIKDGTHSTVTAAALRPKKTRPPKRYTEGDLIADMLDVGKFATNPEVRKRLKENAGIGTEATRGTIIKNLRERGYLESKGKFIISTPLARELIAMRPDHRRGDHRAVGGKAGRTAARPRPRRGARRVRVQGRRQRHAHHRGRARRCGQSCGHAGTERRPAALCAGNLGGAGCSAAGGRGNLARGRTGVPRHARRDLRQPAAERQATGLRREAGHRQRRCLVR
ncbi:hypothetical protein JH262_22340 (plasmid) [Xanthomonas campestris pv. incanae]|nr:hypothetical protein JH262_22340 [Xanthomonas campestris pv. incanae]